MHILARVLASFLNREDGPTAVEYAVMLALIIALCSVAIGALGSSAKGSFTKTASAVGPAAS
jgi:pilus assembly protein Flp/PilA